MIDEKALWNKLATKNSRYYIDSGKGKGITEYDFKISGKEDYYRFILHDELIRSTGKCLEIGCGTGRMTEFIARDFMKVIGVDISGEMIRQGKDRLEHLDNVELIETDGELIPLPDESVDFAFSYLVFQHMKSMDIVKSNFKEVYRVLKKGCIFKVRVRFDKVKMDDWWSGVTYEDGLAEKIGFRVLKTEKVKNYGLWLWLQK